MFDPLTQVFEELPSLPRPLSGMAVVINNSKLYVLGGHDGAQI